MSDETKPNGFVLGETLYLRLKFVVQVLLPALATLYFTLGPAWNLPHVEQVIGTIAAIATFLGVTLGISTRSYNASDAKYDGNLDILENDNGGKIYSLELNGPVEEIDGKDQVIFKVGTSDTISSE